MNIFYLSHCPVEAAKFQCDKHVVKMVLETAQLLCTTQRFFGNNDERLYRSTHVNHPSAVWTRSELNNYRWLFEHFTALLAEYKHRYYSTHACARLVDVLKEPPAGIPHNHWAHIVPPKCMPDEFKVENNCLASYRNYYALGKAKTISMAWTNRDKPDWMETNV